jgi:flavoprotein hydroxylase
MRLPQEDAAELESPGRIWELLAAHDVTPANAVIERSVVYTFQARWVDQWRKGRIFLAGDAAHLMPPFWGQGLCSGLRDAANLAWKLDLVLSGRSDDALLDTYTSERSAHVQHAVHISVALGNIICVTDPQEAAERDAAMLAAGADPARILAAGPPARLGPGVLQTLPDGTLPPGVGVATPHPRVQANGVTGLSDDVVGRGFLVAAVVDPRPLLSPAQRDLLERLGARVVHLVAAGAPPPTDPDVVVDVDGALLAQLAGCGAEAVIVRPDAYLFGAVTDARDLPALVDELRDLLQVAPELPVPPDLQVEQELQAEQEQ